MCYKKQYYKVESFFNFLMFCKSLLTRPSIFFLSLIIQFVLLSDTKSILLWGLNTITFERNSFAATLILSNYIEDMSTTPRLISAAIFYTVSPLNGRYPVNKKWAITPNDQTSLYFTLFWLSRNASGAKYGMFKILIGSLIKMLLRSINLMGRCSDCSLMLKHPNYRFP